MYVPNEVNHLNATVDLKINTYNVEHVSFAAAVHNRWAIVVDITSDKGQMSLVANDY